MGVIVSGYNRRALVAIVNASLAGQDRAWLEGHSILRGSEQPTAQVIAQARNWTDGNNPGWDLAAGAGNAKVLAGTLPPSALADGGHLRVICTGSYTSGGANKTLLFKLQAWRDFFGASPVATYIGPAAAGNPGWGFSNSQTGTGNFTASGRFLFDVRLHARGYQAAAGNLFAEGIIEVGPKIARDGGIQTPVSGHQTYRIWDDTIVFDPRHEYELTLDVGLVVGGGDAIHIDGADFILIGGRPGFDTY